jgi:hypothetical protein
VAVAVLLVVLLAPPLLLVRLARTPTQSSWATQESVAPLPRPDSRCRSPLLTGRLQQLQQLPQVELARVLALLLLVVAVLLLAVVAVVPLLPEVAATTTRTRMGRWR